MQHSRGKAKGVRTMTGEAAALSAAKYAPATCDDELHKEIESGGGELDKERFRWAWHSLFLATCCLTSCMCHVIVVVAVVIVPFVLFRTGASISSQV